MLEEEHSHIAGSNCKCIPCRFRNNQVELLEEHTDFIMEAINRISLKVGENEEILISSSTYNILKYYAALRGQELTSIVSNGIEVKASILIDLLNNAGSLTAVTRSKEYEN